MSEDREKEGLKHLGNNTKYSMDYAPEVLETFVNKHPQTIIGYSLIVQSSPLCAQLQVNPTLPK